MSKKPSWHHINYPALKELLEELELPYEEFSEHHFRIMGATHIIDLWPARMTYHRHAGETIKAHEPYHKTIFGEKTEGALDRQFNKEQVTKLLTEGKL